MRHCEEPTGPAFAGPMINSVTKQSSLAVWLLDCFASLAMTIQQKRIMLQAPEPTRFKAIAL
jgi:hypothetical protein